MSRSQPKNRVVAIGIWLIFLPLGLLSIGGAIELLRRGWPNNAVEQLLTLLGYGALGAVAYVSTMILRSTTSGYEQSTDGTDTYDDDAHYDDDDDSDDGSRFEEGPDEDDDL